MFVKQLLLCSWTYVSCKVWILVHSPQNCKKNSRQRSLFENGKWQWHFPHSRAFSPVWGLWGLTMPLAHLPLGSTFPKDQLPPRTVTTSLDKISAGLLGLGTLSIQADAPGFNWPIWGYGPPETVAPPAPHGPTEAAGPESGAFQGSRLAS